MYMSCIVVWPGPNVWHERWGEDYDAGGDACVKWTDKWAERLLPGGAREQWGDKWHEAFANGRGEKNGEVRWWAALRWCDWWIGGFSGVLGWGRAGALRVYASCRACHGQRRHSYSAQRSCTERVSG